MEHDVIIRTVIITIIAGSSCIVLSERLKFPAIILYFLCGIALGPYGIGWIQPASLGGGLNILITLFVGIILFEGGLSLNISRLKSIRGNLARQIVLTIAITMTLSWLAAVHIAGLRPDLALIFASLTVVTGPTVIKPVIRYLPLRKCVKTFLNGEAVIIDAVGAVLAIAMIEYFVSRQVAGLSILGFIASIVIGATLGAACGISVKMLLIKTRLVPVSSRSIFTLGMLFFVFFVSELISSESGLMAVAAFGLALSTIDYRDKEKLLSFKEQISQIVISLLFILLSAHFNITLLSEQALPGLAVVVIIILARFPTVFASTAGGIFTIRERFFMGWVGPRGIIALSVASIAIIKLKSAGLHNTEIIEILIFMLISVTVLFQSLSAGVLARKLDIGITGDKNIIVLGANPTTIGMALHWQQYQNEVLFVDSNLSNCLLAEKEGFPYIHGNGLAPDTFAGIDVDEYSSVLAASANNEINILFCRFLKETYGLKKLYVILTEKAGEELSEIIQSEGINTACTCLRAPRSANFFNAIKEYFTTKKPVIKEITVTSESFLNNNTDEYPIPENIFILFVVRNMKNCHVYYNGFRLEKNDTLCIIMNDESASAQLDAFTLQSPTTPA
ncbi:MAG TPA: sodium:proton antiporter [Spirochaetota bacterium]|nr:sodium:proton antiporter [Spirochaetota bacterium]HQF10578.1 sodium:proton antiporter [Spirochaetota bacterium]HQH99549.1 sodium:proton antiporter [Spirochaetota bacterium]HQJ73080.1 sodium:proton antiporter [Spirochaetota bacterium]